MTVSRLMPIGRLFLALAFLGMGIEHFLFQEFITGRAPAWPTSLPGKTIWASDIAVVVAGFLFARQGEKLE